MRNLIALTALFALSATLSTAAANDPPAKGDDSKTAKASAQAEAQAHGSAKGEAGKGASAKAEAGKPAMPPVSVKPTLSATPPPAAAKASEDQSEMDLSARIAVRLAEMRANQAARASRVRKAAAKVKEKAAEPVVKPPANGTVWNYDGDLGPANWARINAAWSLCGNGTRQSPIDIRDGMKVDLEQIGFEYQPSSFNEIDNGKTIQVTVSGGNYITVQGRTYELQYITFHRPGETRVNGRGFEMSVHLVHRDSEGHYAVVAIMLERGKAQSFVQTVWNNLPLEKGAMVAPSIVIDVNDLLPQKRDYFTYMGSMTTPPCSEGVLWMVMKEPVQASPDQLALFSRLYPYNARPVQASGGRIIKESK